MADLLADDSSWPVHCRTRLELPDAGKRLRAALTCAELVDIYHGSMAPPVLRIPLLRTPAARVANPGAAPHHLLLTIGGPGLEITAQPSNERPHLAPLGRSMHFASVALPW